MKAKVAILLMAIMVAIFVSGCTSGTPSPTPQATVQPTAQPTSQVSTQPTALPTSQVSNSASVTIQNFAFSPATVTIAKGGTVTWTNKDSTTHTVTFADGSSDLAGGATFSKTFNDAGTFDYHCSIHPSMTGKVVVQ